MATATTASPSRRRALFADEHNDYRESYARFLHNEVVPHLGEWERAQIVPRELFTKCAAHGFLAMEVPEQYGGPGVSDWRFNVVLAEEGVNSGAGAALAGPMLHTDVVLPYLMASATDEQKARWLPDVAAGTKILAIAMTEPGTGSDLAGIKTSAKPDGGGYILNGAKTFITNGINADLVVVAARTSEDKHGGLSLFVVERGMPGFERGKQIEKLGQHASDTAELFFNDVHVPAENRLGGEGSGFFQLVFAAGAGAPDSRRRVDRRLRARFRDDARVHQGAKGVQPGDRQLPEQPLRDGRAEDEDRDHPLFRRPQHRALHLRDVQRRGGGDGEVVDDRPAR